jgi:hypothetical protein
MHWSVPGATTRKRDCIDVTADPRFVRLTDAGTCRCAHGQFAPIYGVEVGSVRQTARDRARIARLRGGQSSVAP